MTEWHPIPGWDGLYEITGDGRVRSLGRVAANGNRYSGKEMTILIRGKYKYVQFRRIGSKKKSERVHRLLALTFIPNPNNWPHVNHIDGNGLNNSLDNLEWCTHAQNMAHASRMGLMAKPGSGKSPGNARLSEESAKALIADYRRGGVTKRQLAAKYSVGFHVVKAAVTGRNYGHVTGLRPTPTKG